MNEQFLEALKVFGTIVLNGASSPEKATEGLNAINQLLVENPNAFAIIEDPNNLAIFNKAKDTLATINFDTISLLDAPKIMGLLPELKKIDLHN